MTERTPLPRAALGEIAEAVLNLSAAKKALDPLLSHENNAIMTRATRATNSINEAIIKLQKAQVIPFQEKGKS